MSAGNVVGIMKGYLALLGLLVVAFFIGITVGWILFA